MGATRSRPARPTGPLIRIANAPVSYGAFEQTVGVLPNVPAAEIVLDAIAAAGYEGTELGPYGYFGTGDALRDALARRGLALTGAFVEVDFRARTFGALERTIEVLQPFGAQLVLADAGPRDGDVDLEGVARALELARDRGHDPVFHHHMGTRVETVADIERLLGATDIALLLDTGHLAAAGGDPVRAVRDWHERIRYVHLKDASRAVIDDARDWDEAWRNGAFCELGTGDVDLAAFFDGLAPYEGWVVVEQDWFPGDGSDPTDHIAAQDRNRRWLRDHIGI
jgi:inosose dehydratase